MTDDDTEAQIAAACERIGQLAAKIPEFPSGQTATERITQMLKDSGYEGSAEIVTGVTFPNVPERVEVTYMTSLPASRRLRELDTWVDWPTVLPPAKRHSHRCDERCACPVDGKPMLYWPAGGEHACQDPECRYAHGAVDA